MSANGSTQARVLRLDEKDNVLVALADLHKGEIVGYLGNDYPLLSDVSSKHKFLTQDVNAGGVIIMYGVLVGHTVENLRRGDFHIQFGSSERNAEVTLGFGSSIFCGSIQSQ